MSNPGHVLTGEQFLRQLRSDEAITPPIVLTGMAKKPQGDAEYILFVRGTTCSNWIKIAAPLIERVDVLRVVPCADHSHPLVRLHLRAPESDLEALLATLLQHGTSPPVVFLRRPQPQCHFDYEIWCDEDGDCEERAVFHCGGH